MRENEKEISCKSLTNMLKTANHSLEVANELELALRYLTAQKLIHSD